MATNLSPAAFKEAARTLTYSIHPQVHKALRKSAADTDQTISERLHDILCVELGLEHLLLQSPDPIEAR